MFNGRIQLACVSCPKDDQKRKCEKGDMFLNLNIDLSALQLLFIYCSNLWFQVQG